MGNVARAIPFAVICVSLVITAGAMQRVSTQSPPLDQIDPNPPVQEPPLRIEKVTFPEQRYRVIARYPDNWSCDPDSYPVVRVKGERVHAIEGFVDIAGDRASFQTIAKHLGLDKVREFSDDQKVLIYREYKKLMAIRLEPQDGAVKFTVRVPDPPNKKFLYPNGHRITGLIDSVGNLSIQESVPDVLACPVCLAAGTRIDTPSGQVAVQDMKPGMFAWTLDARHRRVAMPILMVSAVSVPPRHMMVHLHLSDGRGLIASPGHPTADGRHVEDLQADGTYDGSAIRSVEIEPYQSRDARTFDILPAGDTGFYWANGILLASTLKR